MQCCSEGNVRLTVFLSRMLCSRINGGNQGTTGTRELQPELLGASLRLEECWKLLLLYIYLYDMLLLFTLPSYSIPLTYLTTCLLTFYYFNTRKSLCFLYGWMLKRERGSLLYSVEESKTEWKLNELVPCVFMLKGSVSYVFSNCPRHRRDSFQTYNQSTYTYTQYMVKFMWFGSIRGF